MRSEFEKSAMRAAVDAVEARYNRDAAARKAAARKRRLSSIFSVTILLFGLLVGGYVLMNQGMMPFDFDAEGFLTSVTTMFRSVVPNDAERAQRNEYAQILLGFTKAQAIGLWRDADDSVKPRNAAPGQVYYGLVPVGQKGVELYRFTAHGAGKVSTEVLSPLHPARQVDSATFKKACSGSAFLIAVKGKCYLCGSDHLPDSKLLLSRVHALFGQ